MYRIVPLLLTIGIVLLAGRWAAASWARPEAAAQEEGREQGYAVGFFRDGQSPERGVCPSESQVHADLDQIADQRLTDVIRIYGQGCLLDRVPEWAEARGIGVYTAAYCDRNEAVTAREIQAMVQGLTGRGNVRAAVVCNEVRLFDVVPEARMVELLNAVRSRVSVPVTTAEPWHVWRDSPNLAAATDLLLVHIHPYHDGVCAHEAAGYVARRVAELRAQFPDKRIVIGETGWPTGGPAKGCVVPDVAAQEQLMRELLPWAAQEGVGLFWFQLFDEAWKTSNEGPAGATWGSHTADRRPKHSVRSVVVP